METFASVKFSQKLFSRLLVLYPRGYREEFGPHMSQLFKDCSREALALRGTTGLITLWLATLPDLFKTAFEENFKEITHMSKEKFHRLGRWAFVLGAALFLLAFVIGSMETSTEDPLGGPAALIEYFKLGVAPLAMLLFFVGIASLRSAYGDAAGSVAKAMLSIAAIGSLVGGVGAIGTGLMLSEGTSWYLFFGGTLFMLLGIGVFGIYCMQRNVLPGLSWLFVLGGLTLPLLSVLGIIYQTVTDSQSSPAAWISQLALGVTALSLIAAGLQLQGAETTSKATK